MLPGGHATINGENLIRMENSSDIFTDESPTLVPDKDKRPGVGKWVVVVTRSFQTLGLIDRDGVWRDVRRGRPIDDVRSWRRLFDPPELVGE